MDRSVGQYASASQMAPAMTTPTGQRVSKRIFTTKCCSPPQLCPSMHWHVSAEKERCSLAQFFPLRLLWQHMMCRTSAFRKDTAVEIPHVANTRPSIYRQNTAACHPSATIVPFPDPTHRRRPPRVLAAGRTTRKPFYGTLDERSLFSLLFSFRGHEFWTQKSTA